MPGYGDPQPTTDWGQILRVLGVPLASAAVGVAAPQTLAGAAGMANGYNQGRQQAFNNNLATQDQNLQTREQNRKEKATGYLGNTLADAPEGFEIIGYDQKGNKMIRKIQRNVAAEKFDLEAEDTRKQRESAAQFVKDSAIDTLKTIEEVEKGMHNFGLLGSVPSIPGTDRKNWESNINKLTAQQVINLLTTMKQASKTGATGFGQLNIKELEKIENAATALKKTLPPKDAQRYINIIKEGANKVLQGDGNQDKINKAKAAGYSDEEIQQYLQGQK